RSLNPKGGACERPTPCCGSSSHRVCAYRVPVLDGRRWVERCLCGAIRDGSWEQFRGGQEEHGSGIADMHRSGSARPQNGGLNTLSVNFFHSRCSQPCDLGPQLMVVRNAKMAKHSICNLEIGDKDAELKSQYAGKMYTGK